MDAENPFIKAFKEHKNIDSLSRELLIELVNRIIVHEGGELEINFNFPDALKKARDYIEENSAE